ncbi:hypothetical protein D1B31_04815 [Neobacillus notoginsengisoli]|uniref:Uncharacterized protein n=1 Tax=Neobacillus notoginsengisoli TaxID=1578198 RepID=A0A417YWU8_9BACI|nr:hypothetical protein [Neobacillus notoginsengisoli]RHW41970.1 hypothetical protein D1B31_04815 [Neobacillus notoginsengisoli]
MIAKNNETEPVAEKRLGFTIGLHLFLIVGASMPEDGFFFWLAINLSVEALLVFRVLTMWNRYKHDTKRYYSIQAYWMLIGFSIYTTMPFVRMSYVTPAFWPVLIGTLLLFLLGHLLKERIGKIFVNPRKIKQLVMWPTALAGIIIIGIAIMAVLRFQSVDENVGLAVFLYMLGVFSIFTATPFSLTEEVFEKLKAE